MQAWSDADHIAKLPRRRTINPYRFVTEALAYGALFTYGFAILIALQEEKISMWDAMQHQIRIVSSVMVHVILAFGGHMRNLHKQQMRAQKPATLMRIGAYLLLVAPLAATVLAMCVSCRDLFLSNAGHPAIGLGSLLARIAAVCFSGNIHLWRLTTKPGWAS